MPVPVIEPVEFRAVTGSLAVSEVEPFVLQPQQDNSVAALLRAVPLGEGSMIVASENGTGTTVTISPVAAGSSFSEFWLQFDALTGTARRLGVYGTLTSGAYLDGGALLRDAIDQLSGRGLTSVLNGQLVGSAADGTGETIKSIVNQAGIASQAKGSDTRLHAVIKAAMVVRTAGYPNNLALVLHPTDLQNMLLDKTASSGSFQYSFRRDLLTEAGVQYVVNTPSIAQGTPLVGSFSDGAALLIRDPMLLSASDSNATTFVEGKVTLKLELRAQLAVRIPAFCKITSF
jgi:hypothetical protein